MLKPTALALIWTLLQVPGSESPRVEVPLAAEYPPQDALLVNQVNQGAARAAAATRARQSPADVETIRALAKAQDIAGAIQSLRLIVNAHPERIADAAEALHESTYRLRGDDEAARENQEAMRLLLEDARAKLPGLPRDDAARAERVFIQFDAELAERSQRNWPARLAQFIAAYAGTSSALLSEVDLIAAGGVSQQMFDALDRLVDANPGTEAAAKALYQKGFQWHTINTLGRLEARDADPTARFLRVVDIVRELQSGRYAASEWTAKAPSLVIGFFIPDEVTIAPENIDLLIRHFTETARQQLALGENAAPDGNGIVHLVTKIGNLYEREGERAAGVERTLDELEQRVDSPAAVRLLLGLVYLQAPRQETAAERGARLTKARDVLRSLSTAGRSLNHRRALATLAALEFAEGRHSVARPLFVRYAELYPASPWTWVARIRMAQCLDAQGDVAAAAAEYEVVAEIYGDMPLARVLGAAYAARAYEAAGEFKKALASHRRALAGWDNAFGLTYSSYARRPAASNNPFELGVDEGEVRKDALASRIERLQRTLRLPGGESLERGRALLARERYVEAADELDRIPTQSSLASEARALANRAKVEAALGQIDVGQTGSDQRAALAMLDGVRPEPVDASVIAAAILRSALLLLNGAETEAEALLAKTLEEWHRRQPVKKAATPLEGDVAQIRRVLFLPRGGEIYRQGRWNAFEWPASEPPVMVVNADLRVKLHGGEAVTLTISEPLPDVGRLLFFDTETIALLQKMLSRVGGTTRRQPGSIMETPHQPVGDARRILALWQRFFPARPGHWAGWELETYPVLTQIRFADAARTKAFVNVTIGYAGATVELEKESGRWIARRLTNQWVT